MLELRACQRPGLPASVLAARSGLNLCSPPFHPLPFVLQARVQRRSLPSTRLIQSRGGRRESGGRTPDGHGRASSGKGNSYQNKKRRRGRPAWFRSPNDTPFRDGNRDRVVGLLTERAARTLAYYLSETNLHLYHWLAAFMAAHPIPRDGAWDDVSGETFLRTLLSMPIQAAKFDTGRSAMYDCTTGMGVDPRNLAQRIMDIRSQIAKEMVVDLNNVGEENALLLRESLASSLEKSFASAAGEEPPLRG